VKNTNTLLVARGKTDLILRAISLGASSSFLSLNATANFSSIILYA
jgi:hypothetical protein